MSSLHAPAPKSTPAPAKTWPSSPDTDDWTWELGPDPSPADEAWAAEVLNADATDYDVDDQVDEHAALEAAAHDAIELGLIPRDLAEALSRSSLVGLADRIIHAGSDPADCGCLECLMARTARYARYAD